VAIYPNDDFPAHQVYASHGYPALNLVTCGGAYDRNGGGYQSNVVVYTQLVHTKPADPGRDASS
jgi:methyl coenzyme M reductase beta subunit